MTLEFTLVLMQWVECGFLCTPIVLSIRLLKKLSYLFFDVFSSLEQFLSAGHIYTISIKIHQLHNVKTRTFYSR